MINFTATASGAKYPGWRSVTDTVKPYIKMKCFYVVQANILATIKSKDYVLK